MIADNYNFKYTSASQDPPSSKSSSLFKPSPVAISPISAEGGLCTSVDPEVPADSSSIQPPAEPSVHLSPPDIVIAPDTPEVTQGTDGVEGAVGGVDENLLSPDRELQFTLDWSLLCCATVRFLVMSASCVGQTRFQIQKKTYVCGTYCEQFHFLVAVNHQARRAQSIERRIGAILRDKGDKYQDEVSKDTLTFPSTTGLQLSMQPFRVDTEHGTSTLIFACLRAARKRRGTFAKNVFASEEPNSVSRFRTCSRWCLTL